MEAILSGQGHWEGDEQMRDSILRGLYWVAVGLPVQVVKNQGSIFMSREFNMYISSNKIEHYSTMTYPFREMGWWI